MPSRRIDAISVAEPAAAALRAHALERGEILSKLQRSFEVDPRVRSAWLWGSFMRGEQDDLSDLDLWLLVEDEHVSGFAASVCDCCKNGGAMVHCAENAHNAPPEGGYLGALLAGTHGLHHLDIYWQPVSQFDAPTGAFLDRRTEASTSPVQPIRPLPPGAPTNLAFIWLMLSVTAKYLARDPESDMKLLTYPRPAFEESCRELGIDDGDVQWDCPDDPRGKVEVLRGLVEKTRLIEEGFRAAGHPVSPIANPCLQAYLDLVEWLVT